MLIDLSARIRGGMTVVPGDPAVELVPALTIAADGVAVTSVRCGSHTGTHVDAPAHLIPDGRTIDRVAPDELVGEAAILSLEGLVAGEAITADMLLPLLPGPLPPIVFMATGWDRHDGALASDHPVVTPDAALLLVERGMHALGVDTLSPDPTLQDGPLALPVHEAVLGADGLIVENLVGLTALPARVRVGVFPLPLAGADAAPARALAWV